MSTINYHKKYATTIAYPTILMAVGAMSIYIIASIAAVQGLLGAGWAILINILMGYLLFTPMHEAGHRNIAGNRQSLNWLNEFVGWMSGIPLVAPFYLFKIVHDRHHAHTNDPENDPDHWLASKGFFSLLLHSSTIFPVYLWEGLQLLFWKEKVMGKIKKELRISFIVLGFMLLSATVLGAMIGWQWVILLWVVPALIAQVLLAIVFDWLPHHPHEERSRYLNTRMFDIKGLSFFLLGQNYHLIHHLYPRIPFYDYPKVYVELEEEILGEGAKVVKLGDGI